MRRHRNPTKRDRLLSELEDFNRWLKRQGLYAITLEEYDGYLHGKGLPHDSKVKVRADMPRYEIPAERDPGRFPSVTSSPDRAETARRDNRHEVEGSKRYILAPAYNKGPYMVVPPNELETAGRKV